MNDDRYTTPAIALHWLMAIMLVAIWGVGQYMHELPLSPQKLQIYSWHKWAGVTAFVLVVVRLAWRIGHAPPALPTAMSATMQRAAHAGHAVLYLLMFAVPLTGWLMSSAYGFQTVWFGALPIPDLLGKDKALGDTLKAVHGLLNWLLALAVTGHVLAAIKHQLIDKDCLLARMSWRRASKETP